MTNQSLTAKNINLEKIKELSNICNMVYQDVNISQDVLGWKVADIKKVNFSGFYSVLLKKDKELLLVFRGTNDIMDWIADGLIGLTVRSSQFRSAEEFYGKIIKAYPEKENLTIAGHSLGGGLAEYVGAKNGIKTFTFNGVGIKYYLKAEDIKDRDFSNINNFMSAVDLVGNILPHTTLSSFYIKQPQFIINNKDSLAQIKHRINVLRKIATSLAGVSSYLEYKIRRAYNGTKKFIYEKFVFVLLKVLEWLKLDKILPVLLQREITLAGVYDDMADAMLAQKADSEWFKVAHGLEYFINLDENDIEFLEKNYYLED